MTVKAEDLEQTWRDVAGLRLDEMRQWLAENIYELPCMIAYLASLARIKNKPDTLNVRELPPCRFCGKVASYRGKVHIVGIAEYNLPNDNEVWYDMCEGCFAIQGQGVGEGIGYKLELVKL